MGTTPVGAASWGGYSLYQCANGGKGTLQTCSGTNYTHADLNPNDSHWAEGDFVPFQLRLTGFSSGSYTVAIKYKTVDNGLHAYDCLGSFDATETTGAATPAHANLNNPCSTVIPLCVPTLPTDSVAIPAADLSGVNSTCKSSLNNFQPASSTGKFSLWGPTGSKFTGAPVFESPLNQPRQTGGNVSACFTIIDVQFSVPLGHSGDANLVLAWAGHVADAADCGPNTGAGGISGDPYHMSIDHVTGLSASGSEDRAMTVGASQPTITTVIEDAAGSPVTSVPAGSSVHDTATLSGATTTAGGTITYKLFNTADCTGPATSTATVTVTNGAVPDSPASTPTAEMWSYQATDSGDPHNASSIGACEANLTVTQSPVAVIDVVKAEPTPGDGKPVTAGQSTPITYELVVTNSGTAAEPSVVVTDAVPSGVTYVSGTATATPAATVSFPSVGIIEWTIPTVPAATGSTPGEVDLFFKATVDSSDINGSTITNVAAFPALNAASCKPAPTAGTCLTNEVSNPVIATQQSSGAQKSPTTTTIPTVSTKSLALTGSRSGTLGALGAALIGSGGLVLLASRRRNRTGKHFIRQ